MLWMIERLRSVWRYVYIHRAAAHAVTYTGYNVLSLVCRFSQMNINDMCYYSLNVVSIRCSASSLPNMIYAQLKGHHSNEDALGQVRTFYNFDQYVCLIGLKIKSFLHQANMHLCVTFSDDMSKHSTVMPDLPSGQTKPQTKPQTNPETVKATYLPKCNSNFGKQ